MNLESPKVTVKKSQQEVLEFLSNVENYRQIMPDNIDKFESKDNAFLFALKGMPEIKLKIDDPTEDHKVSLSSGSDKFPFSLTALVADKDTSSSDVQLVFDGKFNPMMAMMVKKPLQNFINTLIGNIEKL